MPQQMLDLVIQGDAGFFAESRWGAVAGHGDGGSIPLQLPR